MDTQQPDAAGRPRDPKHPLFTNIGELMLELEQLLDRGELAEDPASRRIRVVERPCAPSTWSRCDSAERCRGCYKAAP